MSFASGPLWGLLYGLCFGLGRSMPAVVGMVIGDRFAEANDVAVFFAVKLQERMRWAGLAVCVLGASSIWVEMRF